MLVAQPELPSCAVETARRWFVEYLCKPHELLGRDGAICPFVAPAIKAGSVASMERPVAADIDVDGMVAIVHDMADGFESVRWPGHGDSLRALVWVLTGIPDEKLTLLDEAHRNTKADLVQRGFILGQFHPHCQETAVHNPDFLISRAPVPMLGLRRMAFHDVLFLNSDPHWFSAYQQRYGDRYESSSVASPALVEMYRQACDRWNR
ncbi:MAG TPA: hypothetical protein VJT49_15275 [Amycolatopsis sp.]|uniref:DUF6875 domain-containing protein n=1 Tax=Amycolatopsis sp. TaxID=37632 RepID=UPI002B47B5FC|nr:hypothetical protein [Amycolatopsis sp.]HKS46440.1 hypothetical protein [Amycolatopsis sp.]